MPNAVTPSVLRIGFHTSVPKTGTPSTSSSRSVFTERLQDDGIDPRLFAHAVLEIRDAGPLAQRAVAGAFEARLHLRGELRVERQPVLVGCDAEQPVVLDVQPRELADRLLVIVDAQVADEIRQASVAAVLLHDEERRRLLAAL